ncbi:hypothetical protein [Leptolyngbya sp. FACHB-711]|nr:hypothetical protein [Leptolyngbya sp. FACHB-711]
MLRQVQRHQVYWFCRHCWQEMPSIEKKPASQVGLKQFLPIQ